MSSVTVRSRFCFKDGLIDAPVGQPALLSRRSTASELDMRFRAPVRGTVDLSHTRVTVLSGNPDSWPTALRMEGVVYDSLLPQLPAAQRLPLLARDPEGFTPQPYEQLATAYRQHGHDGDARTVLLAKQRRLRTTLPWPGRVWSGLQDITVGYGYLPMRAVWWLCAIMLSGILLFTRWPRSPSTRASRPASRPPSTPSTWYRRSSTSGRSRRSAHAADSSGRPRSWSASAGCSRRRRPRAPTAHSAGHDRHRASAARRSVSARSASCISNWAVGSWSRSPNNSSSCRIR